MPNSLRALLFVALTASGCLLDTSQPDETLADLPNIVVIYTDDQDAASTAVMPILQQRVAAQGLTFTNAFVTTSLCCPSRVSLLRGQYAHNHRVVGNRPPYGGWETARALGLERSTVATWLQQRGYRTGFIGKYLNGYVEGWDLRNLDAEVVVPPGWDVWLANWGGYFSPYVDQRGRLRGLARGGRAAGYATDVVARRGAEFIRGAERARGEPFFLVLSLFAPHNSAEGPPRPAPRHAGRLVGATAPRSDSYNEADVTDKPAFIRDQDALTRAEMADMDAFYQGRLESLLAVDDLVDTVVRTLRRIDRLDRTYIFFTSDNGFHLGQHRLRPGKNLPYEEDIRVPLVVRGPGVPAGAKSAAMVLNIDLAPTFAALGDAVTPSFVDGRSMVPLLHGGTAWPREAFLAEHWLGARGIEIISLRTADWVLSRWSTGETEVYSLADDPEQLISGSRLDPPGPVLDSLLDVFRACAGEACRTPELGVGALVSRR